jgi:hypothetical protein
VSILTSRRPARQVVARDTAADLERQIDNALSAMLAASDRASRLMAWYSMQGLLLMRSPRRVREMELERRLFVRPDQGAAPKRSH